VSTTEIKASNLKCTSNFELFLVTDFIVIKSTLLYCCACLNKSKIVLRILLDLGKSNTYDCDTQNFLNQSNLCFFIIRFMFDQLMG